MSNIDKKALREAAEKATKGEWWSDVVETDGEYGEGEDRVSGYHSYAVYVGHESLLDMTNSTAACIHTEWDHDYHMAWDETAKCNAEFIAAANPATVLTLLDELEAAEKRVAELEAREVKLPERYDIEICPTPSPDGDWYLCDDVLAALKAAGIKFVAGAGNILKA
ncbi:ead/Ea22-like family protein [Escherichia coli]|uniref:ead/Ea22-like family protein n=1 Tax=Escherichia coli TaxID=562 RepID=UPI001411CF8D|nr:ead/Ea22-like family protein [Escherichia coli]EMD5240862.1 ead/Ea22-like family protein [Escherichia coli]NHV81977.1 ead/Ea22-like family protein [Escherichia coli]HAW1957043.1 ead/Ea22-like family protein [Escherichia coli]HAW1966813.1 ead/Ea22-like family protein [Escherichia coli]HAW8324412.1 ead/Ea22-like family protein [Escherichia coli]